jgi:hypothetical protein
MMGRKGNEQRLLHEVCEVEWSKGMPSNTTCRSISRVELRVHKHNAYSNQDTGVIVLLSASTDLNYLALVSQLAA